MFRPSEWSDITEYAKITDLHQSIIVVKLSLEVAPINMEAREDMTLCIQQLLDQNSKGNW